jgi:hypothetical protein
MKMSKVFYWSALIIFFVFCFRVDANEDINMNEVRELAKLSVDEILENSPIDTFSIENYWSNVHGRNQPLIVFSTLILMRHRNAWPR